MNMGHALKPKDLSLISREAVEKAKNHALILVLLVIR